MELDMPQFDIEPLRRQSGRDCGWYMLVFNTYYGTVTGHHICTRLAQRRKSVPCASRRPGICVYGENVCANSSSHGLFHTYDSELRFSRSTKMSPAALQICVLYVCSSIFDDFCRVHVPYRRLAFCTVDCRQGFA